MKAIISKKYGSPDVLEFGEVNKPILEDNKVLVKIHASSINYGNVVLLRGKPFLARFAFGLTKPKYPIIGGDIAGRVEAVGKNVKQFRVGDDVFGDLSSCGWGAFSEYASVPEEVLAIKPANLSYEEAAAVPMAAVTALQGLRDKGGIKSGQKILINGASGGVGTFAVQIAKSYGAEVTGVCSTRNIEILRSIGADHVIDYQRDDFTKKAQQYDLIIAVNGYQPISNYMRALVPNGTHVVVGGSGLHLTQAMVMGPWFSITGNKNVVTLLQKHNQKDLIFMKELLEANKVKPVIDKSYKLAETPDAFRYFEQGRAQGKIVINM